MNKLVLIGQVEQFGKISVFKILPDSLEIG